MNIRDQVDFYPELKEYVKDIPQKIENNFSLKKYNLGETIHYKNTKITKIGIVVKGSHSVINILENGNIYLIEKNYPISFIGEVAFLSSNDETSVTIKATEECIVFYLPIKDFEYWVNNDNNFLRILSRTVADKLYRTSYNSGERLFYPTEYIVLNYIYEYYKNYLKDKKEKIIYETRDSISQELGMNIKTLNRAIKKIIDKNLITIIKGKISILNHKEINSELNNLKDDIRNQ